MLSFTTGFWPLFWLVTGGGALAVVAASLLVAVFPPSWLRPRRAIAGALVPLERGEWQAEHERAA